MGGAEDLPKRASSPLKRPASDLEPEDASNQDDIDMIVAPPSDPPETAELSTQSSRSRRAYLVNMLENKIEPAAPSESSQDQPAGPYKSAESEIPSIDAQIKTVTTMIKAHAEGQLSEGDKVFLVSRRWMNRVVDRGTEARKNSKVEPEGEIGPIDNSDIIQQIIRDCDGIDFAQLRHGVGTEAFELFPEDAWTLVEEWYGLMPGSIPIERVAHNTNPDKNGLPNIIFEFHPPIFTIHRLFSDHSGINIPQILKASNPAAPIIVTSRSSRYYDLLKRAKEKTGIGLSNKVRVWRVPRVQPAAEPKPPVGVGETPPSSRPGSPPHGPAPAAVQRGPQDSWTHTLLDVASFTQLEKGNGREVVDIPDYTANAKYNGHSDLSMAGLGEDQTLVLDEHISGENYVSNYIKTSKSATSTALTRTGAATSQPNSGRNSPAPSGPMTRGRTQKNGRTPGTVGLSNLGNTCYMNSALQCVRSVEELTKYFLSGAAKAELNSENPLGNKGEVAVAYWKLLEEIYKDPTPTSVGPRSFKGTIGKFASSFSGYGQQDSQEFLGFLLDGLQEDLSRVRKKPYIEKPDSTDEMVNNPEAIKEMAAKVWDITKKRDDSVIADLFTGMYKSTLVCPVCAKVSITFDPFNNLTLQLPIENNWSHGVFYFPLNDKPKLISVDMSKQGSIFAMKQFISSKVGVPAERLFAAEEFKCKFYKIFDDSATASEEISSNDNCAIYELEAKPTNWPAPRKPPKKQKSFYSLHNNESDDEIPNWDDPLAERMLVPVFHRRPNPDRGNSRLRKAWSLTPVPHYIIVTPEEARNEEAIKRKILEKVATFSTSREFEEDDEGDNSVSESVDPDIVITNGSDADSSGGSKVVANSIDGDDELVDVSKESNVISDSIENKAESTDTSAGKSESKPFSFNSRRPKFVDPRNYLNPSLQNLFVLGYLGGSKEMVPTGWNSIDDDKVYPTLSSRNPQLSQQPDNGSTNGYGDDGSNGSESSDDEGSYNNCRFPSTRMVDESDEDELPKPKALPVRPAAPRSGVRVGYGKGRAGSLKTYSKKGQKNRKFHDSADTDDTEQDAPDEGPLIRLGEGIVVDWNVDAWDAIYGAQSADDTMRGRETYLQIPEIHDPDLAEKRKARVQRRKNGITLEDCLNEFGKEEILSEMDMWYCPKCKEHRRASKKFELWKTPDVLVMHLKRFSSSALRRDKLDVMVDFPMEGLDLTSRVVETEDGKAEIYDLFAVDDHWGGLGGGHYTAFAKNFVDNEWYEYNDSSVSKVKDPSRVVSQSAYLLFYRRRSEVPLGGPRFKQIIQDYDNPPEQQGPSEDEASESGEDQGLVGNSSLRGSSSPLTGVEAALRHQNLGSGKTMQTVTVNPSDLEQLPPYQSDFDDVPMLMGDGVMNAGLHTSIEEDEGIGMDTNMDNGYDVQNYSSYNPLGNANWSFQVLDLDNIGRNNRSNMISGTGSDIDAASDRVQDNSSASAGSRQGRLEDFDHAIPEGDDGVFIDPSPVPDLDEDGQASVIALQHDLLESRNHGVMYPPFGVPAGNEIDEEPAAEILIGEGDEFKMD